MKKILSLLVIAILMIGFTACTPPVGPNDPGTPIIDDPTDPDGGVLQPGSFGVEVLGEGSNTYTPALPAASRAGSFSVQKVSYAASKAISLGNFTVDNTTFVFFILKNTGDYPITDVALALSNTANFTVSPGAITTLYSEGSSSISTLIRVDINHGLISGKVGQYTYIDPAIDNVSITITGNTVDALNTPYAIEVVADLNLVVDLADWVVEKSFDSGVTWTELTWSTNAYSDADLAPRIRIKNTGNVALKVEVSDYPVWSSLPVGGSLEMTSIKPSWSNIWGNGSGFSLIVDTLGTVFDNTVGTNTVNHHHFVGATFQTGYSTVLFSVLN